MSPQASRKRGVSQAGLAASSLATQMSKKRKPLARRVAKLEKLNKKQQKSRGHKEVVASANVTSAAPLLVTFQSQQGNSPGQYRQSEAFAQTGIFDYWILANSRSANYNSNALRVIIGFIRHGAKSISASTVLNDLFGTSSPARS